MLPLRHEQRRVFGQDVTNTLPRAKTPPPTSSTLSSSSSPKLEYYPVESLLPLCEHREQSAWTTDVISFVKSSNPEYLSNCDSVPAVNTNNMHIDSDRKYNNNNNNTLNHSLCETEKCISASTHCVTEYVEEEEGPKYKRVKHDALSCVEHAPHKPAQHRRTLSVPPAIMFTSNEHNYQDKMKYRRGEIEESEEQKPLFNTYDKNTYFQSLCALQLEHKCVQPPLFPPVFAMPTSKCDEDNEDGANDSSTGSLTFDDLEDVSPISALNANVIKTANSAHNFNNRSNRINDVMEKDEDEVTNKHLGYITNNYCESIKALYSSNTKRLPSYQASEYALFTPELVGIISENTYKLEERLNIDNYRDLM